MRVKEDKEVTIEGGRFEELEAEEVDVNEMGQINLYLARSVREAFRAKCKEMGTSMQAELKRHIWRVCGYRRWDGKRIEREAREASGMVLVKPKPKPVESRWIYRKLGTEYEASESEVKYMIKSGALKASDIVDRVKPRKEDHEEVVEVSRA